jgi:hypothetical protein
MPKAKEFALALARANVGSRSMVIPERLRLRLRFLVLVPLTDCRHNRGRLSFLCGQLCERSYSVSMDVDATVKLELQALCAHPRLRACAWSQVSLEQVLNELLSYGRVSFRAVADDWNESASASVRIGCILRLRHGHDEGEEPRTVMGADALADVVVGSGLTSLLAALRCLVALLERFERDLDLGVSEIESFLASLD